MKKKESKHSENVCLTAYRVVAILMMLKIKPHTEAEINENLKNNIELPRELSKDSIWLYINTLKAMGCFITRPTKNNGYKYILKDHPFKLNLTEAELKSLIETRKYISNLSDWEVSINFDKFLSVLYRFLPDEDKQVLAKHCKANLRVINYVLKKEMVKELELHCKNNDFILIKYISPSGNISEIELLTQSIKYEKGALYLWGYNYSLEEYQYLRVDRIESIKKLPNKNLKEIEQPISVIFKLYGPVALMYNPDEDETIINNDNNSITVEAKMKNKFKLIQKILSFGKDCEVLEPDYIQKEIVKKLKLMSSSNISTLALLLKFINRINKFLTGNLLNINSPGECSTLIKVSTGF